MRNPWFALLAMILLAIGLASCAGPDGPAESFGLNVQGPVLIVFYTDN